ncbi:MAG: LacI family DNA-binding transcriptional regulator [Chloroflexi bacterium]|nr:LacI family DNA-binding transcriptional regulator [Chloroflexota bacterium]
MTDGGSEANNLETAAGRARRTTHRDVARHAGVSPAVVSYVINGGPRTTAPDTRERVLRAIQELGYQPNVLARGLRVQRTQTIGFVDSDYAPLDVFVSPYSAAILTGLTAELSQRDYHLLISPIQVGEDAAPLQRLLRSGRLDGLVVRLVEDSPATVALLEMIAATGMPCVCIERPADPRNGFSSVVVNDEAGAFDAVAYLAERGHRRIAHIAGDRRYASAQAREAGYRRALAAADLPPDEELVVCGSWAPFAVDAALDTLLALPDPPTAIFAASDSLAFRLVEVARARGRRIPDDLAVIGFDDIPLAQEMVPPLTTVQIPLRELGRQAGRRVLDLIDGGPNGATTEVLPVRLAPRGTA